MPARKTPIVTNYYYHVVNRSVGQIPIFKGAYDFKRLLRLINYYRFAGAQLSFSRFISLSSSEQSKILQTWQQEKTVLIEIICFCLMSNHFHFLIKQVKDRGISDFIRKIQDSYAKYFNLKNQRAGPLFQGRFQAILVKNEGQLLHLSRYIHLNPYTAFIVKDKEKLTSYQWSSLNEYLKTQSGVCQTSVVLSPFKNPGAYLQFILNQADYQRSLDLINHLVLESPGVP